MCIACISGGAVTAIAIILNIYRGQGMGGGVVWSRRSKGTQRMWTFPELCSNPPPAPGPGRGKPATEASFPHSPTPRIVCPSIGTSGLTCNQLVPSTSTNLSACSPDT